MAKISATECSGTPAPAILVQIRQRISNELDGVWLRRMRCSHSPRARFPSSVLPFASALVVILEFLPTTSVTARLHFFDALKNLKCRLFLMGHLGLNFFLLPLYCLPFFPLLPIILSPQSLPRGFVRSASPVAFPISSNSFSNLRGTVPISGFTRPSRLTPSITQHFLLYPHLCPPPPTPPSPSAAIFLAFPQSVFLYSFFPYISNYVSPVMSPANTPESCTPSSPHPILTSVSPSQAQDPSLFLLSSSSSYYIHNLVVTQTAS